MKVITLCILAFAASTQGTYIRVNNTGTQNLLFVLEAVGYPAENITVVEPGNFTEIFTLDEWNGSFYAYPENCLGLICDYPVTKITVSFRVFLFDRFIDFLMVDLNHGFNVPASLKSLTRSDCDASCNVNLLELCPEEDQIKNEEEVLVACATSSRDYQDWQKACPQAEVDGTDLAITLCASADYEITFG